jgi:hypothetical protein
VDFELTDTQRELQRGVAELAGSFGPDYWAASGAAMNGCSTMHLTIFGLNVLVKHGDEALRREVLPRAVDGSPHVCFALPGAGAGPGKAFRRSEGGEDGADHRFGQDRPPGHTTTPTLGRNPQRGQTCRLTCTDEVFGRRSLPGA